MLQAPLVEKLQDHGQGQGLELAEVYSLVKLVREVIEPQEFVGQDQQFEVEETGPGVVGFGEFIGASDELFKNWLIIVLIEVQLVEEDNQRHAILEQSEVLDSTGDYGMNGADGLRAAVGVDCKHHQKPLIEAHPQQLVEVEVEQLRVELHLFLLVLALQQTDHVVPSALLGQQARYYPYRFNHNYMRWRVIKGGT